MKIYRNLASIPVLSPTAVALGLFDGVHLGHRAVIQAAVRQKENGLTPAVFTFSTHQSAPSSKGALRYICTDSERLSLFESLGVEVVFMPEFGEFQSMSAPEFIRDLLGKRFCASFVSCGFNFHFGAYGAGDTALLRDVCDESGIRAQVIEPFTYDGAPVSSTRIRALLEQGELATANILLGAPYFVCGEVVHGFAIGHTIGFPTANQLIDKNRVVPKHGVYATLTEVDGKVYRSVSNIGIKPTISGSREPLCETHIIGLSEDLYGKNIRVSFLEFLRPEVKFSGLDELKKQIALDRQHSLQTDIP